MGHVFGKIQNCSENFAEVIAGRRKRRRSVDSNASNTDEKQAVDTVPKRKKLLTTTQYIYQALFKEQKNYDITIMAQDKVWCLHKVYLCQSPYFYNMFNGTWREAHENFVHLKDLDNCITIEALDAVFGSMYSDEIAIDKDVVIPVLATATLFHLETIIEKCGEFMIENICPTNAIDYYDAACKYGLIAVKKSIFNWFRVNLLCIYNKAPQQLRKISIDLMTALTASPDLYVMQTEFSLYALLRQWMFLQLNPQFDPDDPVQREKSKEEHKRLTNAGVDTNSPPQDIEQWSYFTRRTDERSFLATAEGMPYIRTFQKLRTQYLTNHYMDLKFVFNDNIIPKEWLYKHIHSHWDKILKLDHHQEACSFGVRQPQIDNELFLKHSMRCGRMLMEPGYQKWRWTGFNFGIDLILILESRRLTIRRHHRHEHERLLTLATRRKFMIRATVTSIDANRQPVYTQTSDILTLSLEKNEEAPLLILDAKCVPPLLLSVNMLIERPANQSFKEIIHGCEDTSYTPTIISTISEIGANCEQRSSTPLNADNDTTMSENDEERTTEAQPGGSYTGFELVQRKVLLRGMHRRHNRFE